MTIAILSNLKKIISKEHLSFESIYNAIGLNTGNFISTNAVYDMITEQKEIIDFNFNPIFVNENYKKLVVPAANWIGNHKGIDELMGNLANSIKQLKIPVIVIGLGVESNNFNDDFHRLLGDGVLNFIKTISEKSVSISLRGQYSFNVFKKLGISNICVTGCPSLQKIYNPNIRKKLKQFDISKILLYPTRYWIDSNFLNSPSLNKNIFNFAFKHKIKINYQSEAEEMAYLSSYPFFLEKKKLNFANYITLKTLKV